MLRLEEEDIYAGIATSGSGGGGGGSIPTVEVTNKTSSAISTGDKVWISPSGGSLEAIDFGSTTTEVPDSDIKGNVVISDSGIAIGFGSGSYIDVGELAMASANTWSIETEITTGNNISSAQHVFAEAYGTCTSCIIIYNNKLQLNLRKPGTSSFLSNITSSSTLSANTTYKIKAEFTGTAYNLYINDVSVGTYSSTTKLETISWAIGACPTGSYTYPFGGSLNINKTSVKLNDTQVFPKAVTTINITEDCYTGQAKEDIAINASGDVTTVASPVKYGATISNFLGDVDANGVLQAPSGEWSLNFSGVKTLRADALPSYFLYKNNGIKTVSFPDLETIYSVSSDNQIAYFAQYSSIERFNCPKLKNFQKASGVVGCNVFFGAFGYCPNFKGINSDNGILFPELEDATNAVIAVYFSTSYITFISFPKLKKISGWDYGRIYMYFTGSASNNKVASINFPLLEELSGGSTNDSKQCSLVISAMPSLETAVFPSLTKVYEHRAIDLSYCTSLTSVSFPALKSNSFGTNYGVTKPFHNMLKGVTGCTVHFPSNMQSVMENMGSVTAGFGGTNTTVLFDLPATE